jgi:hypothetical protein
LPPPNPIVERAVALSTDGRSRDSAGRELAEVVGGDPGLLEEARLILVQRLTRHADDYEASRALAVVNAAIAAAGWRGEHTWAPRPYRLFRLF